MCGLPLLYWQVLLIITGMLLVPHLLAAEYLQPHSAFVVLIVRTDDKRIMALFAKYQLSLTLRVPRYVATLGCIVASVILCNGCQSRQARKLANSGYSPTSFTFASHAVENAPILCEPAVVSVDAAPPITRVGELPKQFLDLSLDEAIQIALQNTEVLRGLGANVLSNPQEAPSIYDPAIRSSDPVFGVEAALAAFDAQFNGLLNYANNDDVFNNVLIGGGANEVQQRLTTGQFGFSKISATGTQYSIRNGVENDINDRTNNLFENSWTTFLEAQMRQPLMQGAGLEFNRIAGPNGQPGLRASNGVLIGRINTDISIAQLERNLIRFVDEVINQYWQLHFAYNNYNAILKARNGALETWNITKARFENDLPGGEADREAQAREQLFNFEGRLILALSGDRDSGAVGLLQTESNLRRLLNMPQSDGSLVRPSESPELFEMIYDWPALVCKATQRRVEVREQQWRLKRRELELTAAKNFLLPRVDALATYRNNGFGEDLWGGGAGQFPSALKVASDGDYQEFEFGLEVTAPVGYRQASAAVQSAKLQLAREKGILREQQQQIAYDLGAAVRRIAQAYDSALVARQRMMAAQQTVDARLAAFEAESAPFDELLEAQRRLAEAEVNFFRRQIIWAQALEGVSRESGELLQRHFIQFSEESGGMQSMADLERKRRAIGRVNSGGFRLAAPGVISQQ